MPDKFHFKCSDCGAEYPGDRVIYLCPACDAKNTTAEPPRGVLKTVYDYARIAGSSTGSDLFGKLKRERFLPLLPLRGLDSWPKLRIGGTPLYEAGLPSPFFGGRDGEKSGRADERTGGHLFLKDDSQNPTFSFKDRASALVSAWARENGITALVAASTGNAGSSLAGICASQGQRAVIVVPASAPLAKLTQILMYGACLIPVKGTYDDAFNLSVQISAKYGFYNRNTAYNPLTIEGKKTVAFELFDQMDHSVPDRIFIPVGDGVIFSGVCRGYEDLMHLGIINRMPVLVAVQSAGSCNVAMNLAKETFTITPSRTIADSISVDVPKCYRMTAGFITKYHGESVLVSDEEIRQASLHLSCGTGIFSEPAAAAAYAGMMKYLREERISPGSRNVVLLTGSGLKDPAAVQSVMGMPDPVDPDLRSTEELLRPVLFPDMP